MKMSIHVKLPLALLAAAAWLLAPPAPAADHAFVGAEKCKPCHNSAAKGSQFDKWAASKHAKAYETLGTDEAKKLGAARGVAEPQKDPRCLKCHVTGFEAPAALKTEKHKAEEGVSCESCHGAGGDYWKMTVMKDRQQSIDAGMIVPDEKTCTGCHNAESPTFKSFDFAGCQAKIAHPDPTRKAGGGL
jgi:hypothetical protein